MFSLIYARMNGWVNKCEAGDLRRHRADYDVTVMCWNTWHFEQSLWTGFYNSIYIHVINKIGNGAVVYIFMEVIADVGGRKLSTCNLLFYQQGLF